MQTIVQMLVCRYQPPLLVLQITEHGPGNYNILIRYLNRFTLNHILQTALLYSKCEMWLRITDSCAAGRPQMRNGVGGDEMKADYLPLMLQAYKLGKCNKSVVIISSMLSSTNRRLNIGTFKF